MKKYILVAAFILLFIAFIAPHRSEGESFPSLELGSQWEKGNDFWGVLDTFWTLKTDPEVFVSVMSHNNSPIGAKIATMKKEQILEEFKKGRKALFALNAVTNWKVSNSNLSAAAGGELFTMSGTYLDSNATPTSFEEIHFWKNNRYTSYTVIYPEKSEFAKTKAYAKITKRILASVEGGGQ